VPVWLDFEGTLEHMFGIVPGGPNLVVLDTTGVLQGTQNGHLDELEFKELAAGIDRLRMQSRAVQRTAAVPGNVQR
jgi:hypothetical protein